MNDAADGSKIDRAMEHLPAPAAETPNPARRGSNRQRNQQYKSSETHGDEGALGDVFPHPGKIEGLIRPEISEKVQGNVEKSEQPEHAAEADEVRELEELAEWRDAKGVDEKPQRPIAGGVLQEFNGIRAEIALDDAPNQIAEGDQAEKKDCDFGPFADEDCAHAACPP